jgi:hypothetical protein
MPVLDAACLGYIEPKKEKPIVPKPKLVFASKTTPVLGKGVSIRERLAMRVAQQAESKAESSIESVPTMTAPAPGNSTENANVNDDAEKSGKKRKKKRKSVSDASDTSNDSQDSIE